MGLLERMLISFLSLSSDPSTSQIRRHPSAWPVTSHGFPSARRISAEFATPNLASYFASFSSACCPSLKTQMARDESSFEVRKALLLRGAIIWMPCPDGLFSAWMRTGPNSFLSGIGGRKTVIVPSQRPTAKRAERTHEVTCARAYVAPTFPSVGSAARPRGNER